MSKKFYDTCSLLLKSNNIFDDDEVFVISSITLKELEYIKTSQSKDAETKYAARRLLQSLLDNDDKYITHIYHEHMLQPIREADLEINEDMKILATAIDYAKQENIQFVTNDGCLWKLARLFFDDLERVDEDKHDYVGYYDYTFKSEEDIANFYSNYQINPIFPHMLINQYLILRDMDGQIIDRLCWTANGYRPISFESFDSKQFGKIKPLDVQQQFVADSLIHNKITMIQGPAGSGKTLLSLGFLFNQLEKGRINKIIVFCNTVAAKDAAKLGFLPGDREEKLIDSQIGNLLISKLGSQIELEKLMENETLVLLPMSDIRGYDTTGMRAGIYISEAQNLSIPLMKLALQRIGNDSICIIDGDAKTQVDDISFAGSNNGMRRASKIFKGHDCYGEVRLKEIHRSAIARIAENM